VLQNVNAAAGVVSLANSADLVSVFSAPPRRAANQSATKYATEVNEANRETDDRMSSISM